MKKVLILLAFVALMTAGCSKTWSGVKQDTSSAVENTRDVIHEATAPKYDRTQTLLKVQEPETVIPVSN